MGGALLQLLAVRVVAQKPEDEATKLAKAVPLGAEISKTTAFNRRPISFLYPSQSPPKPAVP